MKNRNEILGMAITHCNIMLPKKVICIRSITFLFSTMKSMLLFRLCDFKIHQHAD